MQRQPWNFSLWGLWTIHCQIVISFLLSGYLPQGSGWNVLAFLLSLLLLGLNLGLNYVWAVLYLFGSEEKMGGSIPLLVLLTILLFASLGTGGALYQYYHFQVIPIHSIQDCQIKGKPGDLFWLKNARIQSEYAYQASFTFHYATKGSSPQPYLVHYGIVPVSCEKTQNDSVQIFLCYHDRADVVKTLDLNYIAWIPKYTEYNAKYPVLWKEFRRKQGFRSTAKPLFLELLDLDLLRLKTKRTFWLMYGVVSGLWLVFALLGPLFFRTNNETLRE